MLSLSKTSVNSQLAEMYIRHRPNMNLTQDLFSRYRPIVSILPVPPDLFEWEEDKREKWWGRSHLPKKKYSDHTVQVNKIKKSLTRPDNNRKTRQFSQFVCHAYDRG